MKLRVVVFALAFIFALGGMNVEAAEQSPDLVPGLSDNWYHYNQGIEDTKNGDFGGAAKQFDYYLRHPEMHQHMFGIAHFGKGLMYQAMGNLDKALDEFKMAIGNDLHPAMSVKDKACMNMGNIFFKLKLYNDAVSSYKKAIEANSKNGDAHYFLGMAYLKTGDIEKAETESVEAKKLGVTYTSLDEKLKKAKEPTPNTEEKPVKKKGKKKSAD